MAEGQLTFNREKTCCFTGHRDRDLPFGGDRNTMGMKHLVSTLQLMIEEAERDGYDTFICGMAEIVHSLITHGHKIRLVCAVPYEGQIRDIKELRDKYLYSMLRDIYPTAVMSEKFHRECYKVRNLYMVERSSRLIGVYKHKEKGSGTLQTISMARKAGLDLRLIKLDGNPVYYIDGE